MLNKEAIIEGTPEDEFDVILNLRSLFDGADSLEDLSANLAQASLMVKDMQMKGNQLADCVDGGWAPITTL